MPSSDEQAHRIAHKTSAKNRTQSPTTAQSISSRNVYTPQSGPLQRLPKVMEGLSSSAFRLDSLGTVPAGDPQAAARAVQQMFDDIAPRSYYDDDTNFLTTFANVLAVAVATAHRVTRLLVALEEKDVLTRELQHRVRNNLHIIHAMLTTELRQADASRQTRGAAVRRAKEAGG